MYKCIFFTFVLITTNFGAFAESNSKSDETDVLHNNVMCNNSEFINCMGITKRACTDIYISTYKHCDNYVENLNSDGDTRSEMKIFSNCFSDKLAEELGRNIDNIEKCGKALEPAFELRRQEILRKIGRNNHE